MTSNIARTFEETLQRHGLFHAFAFLNGITPYRFTGVYRFEDGVVKSVLLYDRKNPELRIGENVPWNDSYCRITADNRSSCTIEESLADERLLQHAARYFTGVLCCSASDTYWFASGNTVSFRFEAAPRSRRDSRNVECSSEHSREGVVEGKQDCGHVRETSQRFPPRDLTIVCGTTPKSFCKSLVASQNTNCGSESRTLTHFWKFIDYYVTTAFC